MPNGEASIVFNLRDQAIRIYDADDLSRYDSFGHAVVSGPRTGCFAIDTFQEERVFGIQFQPAGAFPFFRVPASEMQNQSIDLDCLWHGGAGELRERLLAARSIDQMFAVGESCLFARLVRPLELHGAVAFARHEFLRHPDRASVRSVLGQIGLSSRRFIELFHQQVGLAPKAFGRVCRFQHSLQRVHRARNVEWVQLALDCGYYDQAHFIHEFREFSGLTPSDYLARATDHLNHVPMP